MRKFQWILGLMAASVVLVEPCAAAESRQDAARRVIESAATAMGGRDRLQQLGNFTYTGFGQQVYQDGGGNTTGDREAPPKWRGIIDAQRSFDLRARRAVNQDRRSNQFPFAAPFGLSWNRTTTPQSGAELMDHPLPAVLEALSSETQLGAVTVEGGRTVVQFTTREGVPVWLAVDAVTHLPAWTRRIVPHTNLGDVAITAHFTGYALWAGVQLPLGLQHRLDWRDQVVLMFQVDSYRLDVPASQLPEFPAPVQRAPAGAPAATVTPLAKGVWDVRVANNNGGPAIEFTDHLVLFEANGSAAATLARIDAANRLVPGKSVTKLIVSHHHFDHTAGLRAAVSRGLSIVAHRGNEGILREMVERPAVVHPDELAKSPQTFRFVPVDEKLVLEDRLQRLEIYHVVEHAHMANAVFAYLPAARIMMEGDLGDAEWTWHWWAGALSSNIRHWGIQPRLNVAVHGQNGGLPIEQTLANNQRQAEAAQKFCTEQQEKGIPIFGCPVQSEAGAMR